MIESTVLSLNQIADVWFAWMASMSIQITVLVVVLLVLMLILRNVSARLKYALWMLVPLRLVLPPTLVLVTGWGWWLLPEQNEFVGQPVIQALNIDGSISGSPDTPDSLLAGQFQNTLDTRTVGLDPNLNSPSDSLLSLGVQNINTISNLQLPTYRCVAMLMWFLIAIILLSRLFVGARNVLRIIRNSNSAPAEIQTALFACMARMNVRHSVSIRCSRDVESPMLSGIRKPIILLPEIISEKLTSLELEAVLIHELRHVARRDLLVNLVESVLASIYFFHPCVWLACTTSRRLREEACDEETIAVLEGQRNEYGSGIVKVAELITQHSRLSAVSLLESKSQLKRRVLRILDPKLRFGRRLSIVAIVAIVALGAVVIPGAARTKHGPGKIPSLPSVAAPHTTLDSHIVTIKNDKTLRIVVQQADGSPLADAQVQTSQTSEIPKVVVKNQIYECDDNGIIDLELIPDLNRVRLWAFHDGYVTEFKNWEPENIHELPPDFTFVLQRGQEIGGIVIDPEGNPVANAKVEVRLENSETDPDGTTRLSQWLANGDQDPDPAEITDAEGRWSIGNVPEGENVRLSFLITHPRFLTDETHRSQSEYEVTFQELELLKARFQLKTGIIATGTVADPNGKPVPEAVLVWGDDPYSQWGSQEIKTNADGQFTLPAQKPGTMNVTLIAKGWMPQIRKVDFQPDMGPIAFQIVPGKKLHIRFEDAAGKVVPDVHVQIMEWRGGKSLYNHVHPNVLTTDIPGKADGQGDYIWDWAPDDVVKYGFYQPGQQYVVRDLIAGDEPLIINMTPPTTFEGKVTDGVTGLPVTNYSVTPVTFTGSGRGLTQRGFRKEFKASDFKFEEKAFDFASEIAFQFEAIGYKVQRTGKFRSSDAQNFALNIKLVAASIPKGRILSQDGASLANIRVLLATPESGISLSSTDYESEPNVKLITNKDGVFEYPTPVTPCAVVVATSEGYAEKYVPENQSPGDLVLSKWASVSGQLLQDGKPVNGATVYLRPIRALGGNNPHIQEMFNEKTDGEGRFSFDRVPPVPSSVSSVLNAWQDYSISSNQSVPLDLKPGEHRDVSLGGRGAKVTGKVVLKGENADAIQFRYGLNYLVNLSSGIELPAHVSITNIDSRSGSIQDWMKTTEGHAYLASLDHHFVKLNPDGTFLINGVAEGTYKFLLQIYEPPSGCLVNPVATKVVELDVDRNAVEQGMLDVGEIELELAKFPAAGEVYPNFSFKSLDGSTRRIDEHRGKFVLIDFWASWCAPCVQEIPKLKELNQSLADDSKLTLLSVSLDQDLSIAKEFTVKHEASWEQGFIGNDQSTIVQQNLGIGSLPVYYLIDPEGKVVLRSHEFTELKTQLTEILQSK